jgi:hypothetical protein
MDFQKNDEEEVNHFITLSVAATLTKNYRDSVTTGSTIALHFSKSAVQSILNQSNCTGIRMYYAIDETSKKQLVLVGVDAAGNDLFQGLLADRATLCPTFCSTSNPLNTTM